MAKIKEDKRLKINLFLSVLSVAMTALLIGGASRAEVTLASNSTLVGDWCELKGDDLKKDDFKKDSGRFKRGECGKNDAVEKRLSITRRGFEYMALTCQFIDKKTLENGIEVLAECSLFGGYQFSLFAVEFINKDQIQAGFIKTTYEATSIWEKATCFMVKKDVPLGYLNLREGPGMEFKARDKLAPRQDQLAAMVQTKDGKWTRVIRENGDEVAMEGWVYQGFLDEVECKPAALPSAVSEPPAPPKVRVLSSLPDNASGALPGHEYAEVSMLATPGRTVLDKDSRYLGGKVLEHAVYFRAVAMGGDNVEVRTGCPSACATLMAYIPKERICFAQGSWLGFHLVRAGRDGAPSFEITKWLLDGFPNDIQTWINQRGGLNMMPYRDVWTLHAEELWKMGYRRCGA